MINSPASRLFDETETVCLFSMQSATREWIMRTVPEVKFSLTRHEAASVACYGDSYLNQLPQDYDANASAQMRTILCLTEPCCDSYLDLLRLHVRHVIYPETPFAQEAMRLAIFPPPQQPGSAETEFFGLRIDDIQNAEVFRVRTAGDIGDVMKRTTAYFRRHAHAEEQGDAAALVVKEAVTNCVFHGFRAAGSHERKYDPAAFTELDVEDRVNVYLARAGECLVMRVTDNAGTLGPLRVGNSLDRQKTEQGLFDSRGRGFYLMRGLSQRMVVIVERGVATAVEIYFMKAPLANAGGEDLRNFELFEI